MSRQSSSNSPRSSRGIASFIRRLCRLDFQSDCRPEPPDAWSKVENYRDFSQEQLAYFEPKFHRDFWRHQ